MTPKEYVKDFLKKNYKLKEVPTFKEFNKMFKALAKSLKVKEGEGIDIGYALSLKDITAENLKLSSYEAKKLGDGGMEKYLKNKYKKTFKKDNLNKVTVKEVASFPVYICMIVDLRYCVENGYNYSMKYLLKNINLNAFDIDMIVMAHAVNHSQNLILKEIIRYLDSGKKYDGKEGAFTSRIQGAINDSLSNVGLELQDELCDRLKWLKKPKFDAKKAMRSEANRKDQEQIDRYKKMFPGLF